MLLSVLVHQIYGCQFMTKILRFTFVLIGNLFVVTLPLELATYKNLKKYEPKTKKNCTQNSIRNIFYGFIIFVLGQPYLLKTYNRFK